MCERAIQTRGLLGPLVCFGNLSQGVCFSTSSQNGQSGLPTEGKDISPFPTWDPFPTATDAPLDSDHHGRHKVPNRCLPHSREWNSFISELESVSLCPDTPKGVGYEGIVGCIIAGFGATEQESRSSRWGRHRSCPSLPGC